MWRQGLQPERLSQSAPPPSRLLCFLSCQNKKERPRRDQHHVLFKRRDYAVLYKADSLNPGFPNRLFHTQIQFSTAKKQYTLSVKTENSVLNHWINDQVRRCAGNRTRFNQGFARSTPREQQSTGLLHFGSFESRFHIKKESTRKGNVIKIATLSKSEPRK